MQHEAPVEGSALEEAAGRRPRQPAHAAERIEDPSGPGPANRRWHPGFEQSPGAPGIRSDPRWPAVEARVRQLGSGPDALIEVLHIVQQEYGFISTEALAGVCEALGVPPSQAMGVATFYGHFTLEPRGRHDCVVCTGTVCYLDGADAILERLEHAFGVTEGRATADGALTVRGTRCVGVCAMSPAAMLDGRLIGRVDAEGLERELRAL